MTTLEDAWQAFNASVAEAQELQAAGAGAEVLQDVLGRARELLRALDGELAASGVNMPPDDRVALEQLRAALAELEGTTVTKH